MRQILTLGENMSKKISGCPYCKEQFDVDDESLIGQNLQCSFCSKEFTLQPESVFEVDGAQESSDNSLSQENKQVIAPKKVINKFPRQIIKNVQMPAPHKKPVQVETEPESANCNADEKICPFCGETIKKVAFVKKHCLR